MNTLTTLLRVPQINGAVGGLLGSWRTLFTRPQLPSTLNNGAKPTSFFGIGGTFGGSSSLLNPFDGMLDKTSPSTDKTSPSMEKKTLTPRGVSGRTNIRNHFPRPSEVRRIKRHGWKKRMSTLGGRKILMNRILKGRHIYSH